MKWESRLGQLSPPVFGLGGRAGCLRTKGLAIQILFLPNLSLEARHLTLNRIQWGGHHCSMAVVPIGVWVSWWMRGAAVFPDGARKVNTLFMRYLSLATKTMTEDQQKTNGERERTWAGSAWRFWVFFSLLSFNQPIEEPDLFFYLFRLCDI